jgi:hypothetical protein
MTSSPTVALGLAGALALVAPGPAHAAAVDLYYERTVMTAADARCGLFTPELGSALSAARAQARGAALRSGVDNAALAQVEARALRKAGRAGCRSPDLTLAAGRVRTAFDGLQRMNAMNYPGEVAGWRADRSVSRQGPTWSLLQTAVVGWGQAAVGLVGGEAGVTAVGAFADGGRPYAARLVLRDTARTGGPYLDRRQAGAGGRLPLTARIPPASAVRVFNAERIGSAAESLLPGAGQKSAPRAGWSSRFPAEAAEALAQLDPREAVAVEFVFAGRGGDVVRKAYVEVGDFAAGRAFAQLARP